MLTILMLSAFNTALYILADKWKILQAYERARFKRSWLPEKCEFCLFFWMAFIEIHILNGIANYKTYWSFDVLIIEACIFIIALSMATISRKLL